MHACVERKPKNGEVAAAVETEKKNGGERAFPAFVSTLVLLLTLTHSCEAGGSDLSLKAIGPGANTVGVDLEVLARKESPKYIRVSPREHET